MTKNKNQKVGLSLLTIGLGGRILIVLPVIVLLWLAVWSVLG